MNVKYGLSDVFYYLNFNSRNYVEYHCARPMIRNVAKKFGKKTLKGVEIGNKYGHNIKSILKKLNIEMLFCADLNHDILDKSLKKNSNVKLLTGYSYKVADKIPDELDFVYIDGDHTYDGLIKDIDVYLPKVRDGGFIGGHDWNIPSVCHAVIDRFGYDYHVMYKDWWLVKGEKNVNYEYELCKKFKETI